MRRSHRAAAQAILGARAADRYDAAAGRGHFQKAIAAARPQERMQLRRMAEPRSRWPSGAPTTSRRPSRSSGQQAPSNRQLLALRIMGLIAPAPGAGSARVRGILLLLGSSSCCWPSGFGLVELIALPFGGVSTAAAACWAWCSWSPCLASSPCSGADARRGRAAGARAR